MSECFLYLTLLRDVLRLPILKSNILIFVTTYLSHFLGTH